MARRIRRDLSNKKIRHIVHKQLKESQQSAEKTVPSSPRVGNIIKPLFYFIAFALAIFFIYKLVVTFDITRLLSTDSDSPPGSRIESKPAKTTDTGGETTQSSPPQPVVQPVVQKMQIEILNGCGVAGIAMKTTEFLRDEDIDVVYMGNYSQFGVDKSQVLDRVGKLDNARKIAQKLGIADDQVKTDLNPAKQLEATVILGKDYRTLKPFKNR